MIDEDLKQRSIWLTKHLRTKNIRKTLHISAKLGRQFRRKEQPSKLSTSTSWLAENSSATSADAEHCCDCVAAGAFNIYKVPTSEGKWLKRSLDCGMVFPCREKKNLSWWNSRRNICGVHKNLSCSFAACKTTNNKGIQAKVQFLRRGNIAPSEKFLYGIFFPRVLKYCTLINMWEYLSFSVRKWGLSLPYTINHKQIFWKCKGSIRHIYSNTIEGRSINYLRCFAGNVDPSPSSLVRFCEISSDPPSLSVIPQD